MQGVSAALKSAAKDKNLGKGGSLTVETPHSQKDDTGYGVYPEPTAGYGGKRLGKLFDAKGDAETLATALQSKDSDTIIDLIAGRVNDDLQEIREVYEEKMGRSLVKDIEKAAFGQFENALIAKATPLAEFEAAQLRDAVKGLGTREETLIRILSTRRNKELAEIRDLYMQKYNATVEGDIRGDTTGDFERILCALSAGGRDEQNFVDHGIVKRDAEELYRAGEKKMLGTNEDKFITILTKRSARHLYEVRKEYRNVSVHSLIEAIESEMGTGDLGSCCTALVNRGWYIAGLVREAVKGLGTDDKALIRIFAHIPKDVLADTKEQYRIRFKRNLVKDIEDDTSGDYRRLLRRMCCHSESDYFAILLRESMKGFGTDEETLTHVVTSVPTKRKLEEIAYDFELDYGTTLRDAIKSETSGNYGSFLAALVTPRRVWDAEQLHGAMKGIGTKESVLIDILTSRSNRDIHEIDTKYSELYGRSVEADLIGDTSGNFEAVLVALNRGQRHEDASLRPEAAKGVADTIYKGGMGRWGTNDDVWVSIFTTRSADELKVIGEVYEAEYGHSLQHAIHKETSGDYRTSLQACVDPIGYAADLIYNAVKGLGTDDEALIRLIAGRSKIQLNQISRRLEEQHGRTLSDFVAGDTSGDYRDALIAYLSTVPPEPVKGTPLPTVKNAAPDPKKK